MQSVVEVVNPPLRDLGVMLVVDVGVADEEVVFEARGGHFSDCELGLNQRSGEHRPEGCPLTERPGNRNF